MKTPEENERNRRLRAQATREKREKAKGEKRRLREESNAHKAKVKLKTPPPFNEHAQTWKRSRRLESMPDTEREVIELLRRPVKGSPLNPVTEHQLVPLTIVKLDDDLEVPVLDLD